MKHRIALSLTLVCLMSLGALAGPAYAQGDQKPTVQIPQPGVPEIMTMEGAFVRAAYNNEGYVILGYKLANQSARRPLAPPSRSASRCATTSRTSSCTATPCRSRRQTARPFPWRRSRSTRRPTCARSRHGPGGARLDQLLSAEGEQAVPDWLLRRAGQPGDVVGPGGAEQHPRLPRTASTSRWQAGSRTGSTG